MTGFRPTRCKHCRTKFSQDEFARGLRLHIFCIDAYAKSEAAKAQRKAEKQARMAARVEKAELRKRKEASKTNGKRRAEAQAEVNRWVVHCRDKDLPCISCGRFHQGQYHGGHYRSRGSAAHLALDPRNVHKQCAPCNNHLHGNLIEFRKGLIERKGLEFVEALEADQEPRHYTAQELDAIKADYKAKTKEQKGKE